MTDSYGRTALSWAAAHGNLSVIKLLLAEGHMQPNLRDHFHRPPVFYAAGAGQHTILQSWLVERQTDPNCRDYYGSTLLSVAARNDHTETVEFLLSVQNINANMADNFGRTPVWWADRMKNLHMVKLLTDIGRVRSVPIENDSSPLNEGPGPSDNWSAEYWSTWCDVCIVRIRKAHYYKCGVCYGGAFCICSDCFKVGAHCLDICHKLD